MDLRSYFSGKRITLMRIGLLGRGVGDAAFLAECGADVLVVDDAPEEVMWPSVEALKQYPNIRFKFGPYDLEDFRTCDFVLKGAGTPIDSPEIAAARTAGIPVKMSASWFMELADMPVIGVTGTRGKSTVTHMLHRVLKEAGWPVLLGGNVRGVSTLALLPEASPEKVALFELDSWQLQGFGEARLSPDIAVFTTFLDDHLNYYGGDRDAYLADKANIFLNQGLEDTLILGSQCADLIQERYGDRIQSNVVVAGAHDFRADWSLQVPGEHNRYAAALATEAARALGVADEAIAQGLAAFAGVPGRLELVREAEGISYYNDTTATTPDATLAALDALAEKRQPTLLIMGGADKGLDAAALLAALPEKTKRIVLLAGTGTQTIQEALPDAPVYASLEEAFADVRAHAAPGDAVLLSPAFASFGMFRNEYDRGDRFDALVQSL